MTENHALIDMRGIVKSFNVGTEGELTVLPGCDFQVPRGQFTAVVGASGSGKSTLMNIIGLLDRPSAGTYLLDGIDVIDSADDQLAHYRSQAIGFVFQNFNLVGRISAAKNVEMPLVYAGGQAQRVAIARALANDPDILLADEPTGALDSHTGRRVMDLFHTLHHEHGKTIVFITHNPELAEETERTVTMRDGILREEPREH